MKVLSLGERLKCLVVGAALVAVVSPVEGGTRERSVALLALPDPTGRSATAESQALVQVVADNVRPRGYRVVLAGVQSSSSLDDLTATANSAGVDLVLGMRVLGRSESCAALLAPDRVPMPAALKEPTAQTDLVAYVRQLALFRRAEASGRAAQLAGAVASVSTSCARKPTEGERLVLDSCLAPTVLLAVAPKDRGAFALRLAAIVAEWFGKELGRITTE